MRRPNILILYTDQQRWDAIGANGNPEIKTPNLDRIAAEGLSFTRYFVQNPVCMPSRVSFLTGQYPAALRITHMGVPVPQDTLTLPKMLAPFGYVSANVGKLHFLPHANRDHRAVHPDYGFDCLEISDEPGCYEDAYRAWVRQQAPEHLDAISPGLPPQAELWYRAMGVKDTVKHPSERFPVEAVPFRAPSHLTHSAFVADRAKDFIQRNQDQPWLCIAGFYSPHSPWVAPQEFLDLYDPSSFTLPSYPPEWEAKRAQPENANFVDERLRAARHGYYAMVSEVDHHVGRLLSLLEETGQAEDTIVVFTSDHGEWLGEHFKFGKGYPAHDAASRVPLLLRWPAGIREPGRSISALTEGVDVVPTLLESAGIPIPPPVQGRSLRPLLDAEPAATGRDSALTEQTGWKSLRTERYRYVCERDGKEFLWDLERDPYAYTDVSKDSAYAGALAEMRHLLLQRLIQNEQPLPRVWAY